MCRTQPTRQEVLPGIYLSAVQTERFKNGYLSLTVTFPLNRQRAPLYSLLLSVLRRGTAKYKTIEKINLQLDKLYATSYRTVNTVAGGYHTVGFSAELLDAAYVPDGTDLLGGVLSLMTDMFFTPRLSGDGFCPTYVQQEKKNAADWIRALINQPCAYAESRFMDLFYRDEIWGHDLFGSEREINAIQPEMLFSVWQSLLRESEFVCHYIGSLPFAEVASRLTALFSPKMEKIGRSIRAFPALPLSASRLHAAVTRRDEHKRTGQSHLFLGFHTGITLTDPDFYAMMLCQEILGMSPNNRLFTQVREAFGFCYSVSSEYLADVGDLIVSCSMDASDREVAENAILAQITALQENTFTEAEWEAARKSLSATYRAVADSPKAYAAYWRIRRLYGVADTPDACRRRFAALTRAEVATVARRIQPDTVYFLCGNGKADKERVVLQ